MSIKLYHGTKGLFNVMKYEASKELGINYKDPHKISLLHNEKSVDIDEAIKNTIIELAEK